ncbi:hypothetical protein [Plantactinospora sp. KBS50]|nr:hypothetical protein [Plantactinospora sp. KBS50]
MAWASDSAASRLPREAAVRRLLELDVAGQFSHRSAFALVSRIR